MIRLITYERERSEGGNYLFSRYDENLEFPKHVHYSFELICVLEGALVCETDGEPWELRENEAMLILPGQIHSYRSPQSSRSFLCIFSCDHVSDFYQTIKGKKFASARFSLPDADKAAEELYSGDVFLKKSVLYRLCSCVYGSSALVSFPEATSALAAEIALYVQEKYTENISLKSFAAAKGYSYNYLSSFFSRVFGQNFSAYVSGFRLRYAAHLLETTERSVTEAAYDSGFSTIRNFNISFKRYYGQTPSEYVKRRKIAPPKPSL